VKTFHSWQAQPARTPLNSSSQEAAREGRQRADTGTNVERTRKTRRKRAGSDNGSPGSVQGQLRPPAQWEAGLGRHHTAPGSAPGHWLSQGRSEAKGVPAVPQHITCPAYLLTAASMRCSSVSVNE